MPAPRDAFVPAFPRPSRSPGGRLSSLRVSSSESPSSSFLIRGDALSSPARILAREPSNAASAGGVNGCLPHLSFHHNALPVRDCLRSDYAARPGCGTHSRTQERPLLTPAGQALFPSAKGNSGADPGPGGAPCSAEAAPSGRRRYGPARMPPSAPVPRRRSPSPNNAPDGRVGGGSPGGRTASNARAVPPFPDGAEQEDATGCESAGGNECVKRIPGWRPPRRLALVCPGGRHQPARSAGVLCAPKPKNLPRTGQVRAGSLPSGIPYWRSRKARRQRPGVVNLPWGCPRPHGRERRQTAASMPRHRTNIGAVPRHENSPDTGRAGSPGSGERKSPHPCRQCSTTSFPLPVPCTDIHS